MGNAINQDARAIWLSLVNDCNWWSASALAHHWRPTYALHEVENFLQALAAGGFVAKRKQLSTTQYAFTSDCQHLPGGLDAPTLSTNTGALV